MDERKRQLADALDSTAVAEGGTSSSSVSSPPPSKKHAGMERTSSAAAINEPIEYALARPASHPPPASASPYTASANGPSDTGADVAEGQEKSSTEKLLQFQKEAIWRQMQEYKRECQRMEYDLERMASSRHNFYLLAGRFDAFWHQIQDELRKLASNINGNGATLELAETTLLNDPAQPREFLDQQAMHCMDEDAWNAWLENKRTMTATLLQSIDNHARHMNRERDDITHNIAVLDEASVIELLKKENHRLKSEKERMSEAAAEHRAQTDKLNEKTKQQNDDLRYELKRAERAIDRLKSSSEVTATTATAAASPAAEPYPTEKASAPANPAAVQAPTEMASASENGHLEAVQRLAD
ncbi:hypothetical protein SYNPS1DRAFT_24138, partial [Syncephalis pseudoplumigaleata]